MSSPTLIRQIIVLLLCVAAPTTVFTQLFIQDPSLPTGVVARPYPNHQLTATGGTAPYSFSIFSGALPAGLSMSTAGVISGRPSAIGSSPVTLRVQDQVGASSTTSYSLSVVAPPVPASWGPRASYGGAVGEVILSPNYLVDKTLFAYAADVLITGEQPQCEVYRSIDSGANWTRLPVNAATLDQPMTALVLSPTYHQAQSGAAATALAVTGGRIYKSTDHGQTWAMQANASGAISALAVAFDPAFATNSRVYSLQSTTNATNLYVSINAGTSWSFVGQLLATYTNGAILKLSPDFSTAPVFIAAPLGNSGMIYRSTTGASGSWSAVYTFTSGSSRNVHQVLFSPNFASDNTLMASEEANLITPTPLVRSTDRGLTWSALPTRAYEISASYYSAAQSYWWARLKYDEGGYAVAYSVDNGSSFTPVYAANRRARPAADGGRYGFATAPLDGSGMMEVFYGCGKGLDRSTDSGFSFAQADFGLTMVKILNMAGNGNTIFATTRDGWLKSLDAGANWTWYDYTGGYQMAAMQNVAVSPDFPNDHAVWMSTTGQGEFWSRDGGRSWQDSNIAPNFVGLYDYAFTPDFSAAGTGRGRLFVASSSALYVSANGGLSYTAHFPPANCPAPLASVAVSSAYTTDHVLFAGAGNGAVCKTTDEGVSWSVVSTLAAAPILRLSPNYNDAAAPGGSQRTLFATSNASGNAFTSRSTDGGSTWSPVSGVPSGGFANAFFRSFISPAFATDQTVFFTALSSSAGGSAGIWRSGNGGVSAAILNAPDALKNRDIRGFYMPPGFTGGGGGGGGAVAASMGSGFWTSTDSGNSFQAITGYRGLVGRVVDAAVAGANSSIIPPGSMMILSDLDGVLYSVSEAATVLSLNSGLPYAAPTALWFPCNYSAAPGAPLLAMNGYGLYRYPGFWTAVSGFNAGSYTRFTEDSQFVYAARADGISIRSADCGVTWTTQAASELSINWMSSINEPTGPGSPPPGSKSDFIATANTAPLWGVASTAGPRWSADSGASWTASPGGNDYALPGGQSWTIVRALGINSGTGGREVTAGTTTGLWRTLDGGATWRSVSGTGSGLEATSKNFSAVLTSPTAFGTTDLLVGATGATTGGVYLSGDGGEHWQQVNAGFDPNSLSISSLVTTSCSGCPVQYYSGSYGGGLYTRTITVVAPPFYTTAAGWCAGSTTCTCATATAVLPVGGGTPFRICGSNFQNGLVVEFDGVPASGCTQSSGTVITCTGSPAHAAGGTSVRVRNPDSRASTLPAAAFQFSGGVSRTVNSLRVAKATSNANLTWTCAACTASAPARVYRAQNTAFSLYLEQYSGGTGGAYMNTGAVSTAQNYFWTVE